MPHFSITVIVEKYKTHLTTVLAHVLPALGQEVILYESCTLLAVSGAVTVCATVLKNSIPSQVCNFWTCTAMVFVGCRMINAVLKLLVDGLISVTTYSFSCCWTCSSSKEITINRLREPVKNTGITGKQRATITLLSTAPDWEQLYKTHK